MADKMISLSVFRVLSILLIISHVTFARIHRLKLENDARGQIDLSTFGFLQKGYLAVNVTEFSLTPSMNGVHPMDDHTYGFTLDKTVSTGISPYLPKEKEAHPGSAISINPSTATHAVWFKETKQENCILKENAIPSDNSVSVLFLRMDFARSRLVISGKVNDLKDLQISLLSVEDFTNLRRRRRSADFLSDSYLLRSRVRRAATGGNPSNGKWKTTQNPLLKELEGFLPKGVTPVFRHPKPVKEHSQETPSNQKTTLPTRSKSTTGGEANKTNKTNKINKINKINKANKTNKINKANKHTGAKMNKTAEKKTKDATSSAGPELVKDLKLVNDSIPMFVSRSGKISTYFLVAINSAKEEGLYNLFFHNCHNYLKEATPTFVNLTVHITENNNGNFLSAGQMPLPMLYFSLSILYILTGGYWLYILRSSDSGTVFKIHYLMLVLVFVKAIALLFHSINLYFIQKEGHHEEAFAILYYITHLMKGALLFITIVLIGAGWAFVKHILSDRDKRIFIIVIPLQVLANVAQIIIAETEEGQSQYTTWKEVFILVDLLCCGAILFPVVWSIRHLQEASGTDGKAAINLAKLKIFRHFYIMIVCYIYFTRIIVYLLKITVPFQYEWLDELFKELATFVFFVVTGYKFRPASNNPYLQVSTDSDDEIEMDEVVTKSGAFDDVVRVNVKTKGDECDVQVVNGPAKRESSHDYD